MQRPARFAGGDTKPASQWQKYAGTLTPPDGREEILLDVPKYRFQLAGVLRARDAKEDSRRQQGHGRHALRQLDQEQIQPGAGEGSVLVRAELGRDVRPAGENHCRQPRVEEGNGYLAVEGNDVRTAR